MEQSNLKSLKEITPDPLSFAPEVKRRLSTMVHRLAFGYLGSIDFAFQLKYTSIILMYIENLDLESDDGSSFFSLGNENTPCGVTKVFISEKQLLSFQDEGKRNLVLKTMHEGLIRFAKETEHDTGLLEKAYKEFSSRNYFGSHGNKYQSDNKKYTCQIQSRENWGNADYSLCVTDHEDNETKFLFIARKDYPFFDEIPGLTQENMWEAVLNTPQIFNPIEWQANYFVMYWGKEKYVFDPAKEKVTREE